MMVSGVIDLFSGKYSFLSNFHPAKVKLDADIYPTVEHAFQASKTDNLKWRTKIRQAQTPSKAKLLGRSIPLTYFRSDWNEIRVEVMSELLRKKFANSELKRKLMATHPKVLIEGNWWGDRFWGACSTGRGKIWDGEKRLWYGENNLGILLMELRESYSG